MVDRNWSQGSVFQTEFWGNKMYEARSQTRVCGRRGSTATRSSTRVLKLASGGNATVVMAVADQLVGVCCMSVTLIFARDCWRACLLCTATGEKLRNYFRT